MQYKNRDKINCTLISTNRQYRHLTPPYRLYNNGIPIAISCRKSKCEQHMKYIFCKPTISLKDFHQILAVRFDLGSKMVHIVVAVTLTLSTLANSVSKN